MLVNTVVIVCHQYYSFGIARRQSRAFVREAQAPLRAGRFDEVISVAARYRWSHVATVVGAGLTAFVAAPPEFTDTEAITASERALLRSYKMTSRQLRLGLGTLATIASSAPFIGLLGTVFGILHNAFRGVAMEKSAWMAMVASSTAAALVTTAMGLLVGTLAVWCRNSLCGRVEIFESEISNSSLEAITYLTRTGGWRTESQHLTAGRGSIRCDRISLPHTRGRPRMIVSSVYCWRCGSARSFLHSHLSAESTRTGLTPAKYPTPRITTGGCQQGDRKQSRQTTVIAR